MGLKFTHNGETYVIEFARAKKLVDVVNKETGKIEKVESKFPYTTARLVKVSDNRSRDVVIERTVGVNLQEHEQFTVEGGRIWALKSLTQGLSKELRHLVWTTYSNRFPPKHKKGTCSKCGSLLTTETIH